MTRSTNNPWLHGFAVLTAMATLCLIGVGGLVTSHGAGMAVPDWPTTYGYNMFFFPIRFWEGGIFYEHSHRLVASVVGLMTTILAVWMFMAESRRWLRWFGISAFFAVAIQGLLGGLRVTLFKDEIGIFHATLAQLFLVQICAIALFTSRLWNRVLEWRTPESGDSARRWVTAAAILILGQLVLGASMRHQHAGLAVPDFPLAYGTIYPPTDEAFLHKVNAHRVDERGFSDVTAFQIHLHMAHRITACLVLTVVGIAVWKVRRAWGRGGGPVRFAYAWLSMIFLQAGLGAWTVWSNKAADIATLHVVLGAISLVSGSMLVLALQWKKEARFAPVSAPAPDLAFSKMASSYK